MSGQHSPACGRRIALQLERLGASSQETAEAISRHCDVSLLRAHRTARGYTLIQVAEQVKQVLSEQGLANSGVSHQTVSRWENGQDVPTLKHLDSLCSVYRSRPDQVGFGKDRTREGDSKGDASTAPQIGDKAFPELSSFLRSQSLSENVELLEFRAEQSGYEMYSSNPADFVPLRMMDFAAVHSLLLRQPGSSLSRRLERVAAHNAGFIGIRLTDVSGPQETFNWFSLAQQAARRAGDTAIEAWIAGHTGDGHSCYNLSLNKGIGIAKLAQQVSGQKPSPAAVFGFLAEAGIQSRLGRKRETIEAVRQAERIFGALPDSKIAADGIRIPEYFLRWHQSNALSMINEGRLAEPLRERALQLPMGKQDLIGRGLLHLDAAALRFEAGEVDEGCQIIDSAWSELPRQLTAGQMTTRTLRIAAGISESAPRQARWLQERVRASQV